MIHLRNIFNETQAMKSHGLVEMKIKIEIKCSSFQWVDVGRGGLKFGIEEVRREWRKGEMG